LLDDVVISEIAYSPTSGDEFIELHNRGADTVSLFAAAAPERTWSLSGAVEFQLPGGVQIPPDGYLLIVGDDPDVFRQTHEVPANVPVLGPYTGSLDDVGDDLHLLRPVTEQPDINLLVDRVNYSADLPWPAEAGSGPSSLIRVPLDAYGNDPASWAAGVAFGTPGSSNASIDTTPPSAPSALVWQVDTGPAIHLSWSTASDPETGVVE
jgi:hypothetical protein